VDLGDFEGFETEVVLFVEEGVVFLATVGLDAGCFLVAAGLESAAAFALVVADRPEALALGSDSAGNSSVTGLDAACFAASRQLGKKSSIRWREMELARRQRGQCASW